MHKTFLFFINFKITNLTELYRIPKQLQLIKIINCLIPHPPKLESQVTSHRVELRSTKIKNNQKKEREKLFFTQVTSCATTRNIIQIIACSELLKILHPNKIFESKIISLNLQINENSSQKIYPFGNIARALPSLHRVLY